MQNPQIDWFDRDRAGLPLAFPIVDTGPLTPEGVIRWTLGASRFLLRTPLAHRNPLYRTVEALLPAVQKHVLAQSPKSENVNTPA